MIIKFNEKYDEQKFKRYLIFGKGSISELGITNIHQYTISSSNGFFSIITMFFAIYFLTAKEKINPIQREINLIYRVICGFLSGFLSAPMGIAGGVINTPILKMFGYPIKVAIGSSAAVGFLIALIGAIGFAISGSYLNTNVPLSLGFVNLPTFLIFVPITMFMAQIGARTVHKFDKRLIGKLLGIYLLIISCKLFYEYFSF